MDNKESMEILRDIKTGNKDSAKERIQTFLFNRASEGIRAKKQEMAKTLFNNKPK